MKKEAIIRLLLSLLLIGAILAGVIRINLWITVILLVIINVKATVKKTNRNRNKTIKDSMIWGRCSTEIKNMIRMGDIPNTVEEFENKLVNIVTQYMPYPEEDIRNVIQNNDCTVFSRELREIYKQNPPTHKSHPKESDEMLLTTISDFLYDNALTVRSNANTYAEELIVHLSERGYKIHKAIQEKR